MMKYVEKSDTGTHSVGYEYDNINNLTKLVEIIGTVERETSYTYDEDNRPVSVTTDSSSRSYTYDTSGRVSEDVTEQDSSVLFTRSYTYRNASSGGTSTQPYRLVYTGDNFSTAFGYGYNTAGNITYMNVDGSTNTYRYDSANQLIRENNRESGLTTLWTYDDAGNILKREVYPVTSGTPDPGDKLYEVNYTYDDDKGWGDLLTAYNGVPITHDGIGNPLNDGTWTYTWQHGRQLASMTKIDQSESWQFTYNADGMRTQRTNGATTYNYTYLGSQLTHMTVAGHTIYFAYDAAGVPMSLTYDGATYYYITNLQGDVIAILDSTGTEVVRYAYDAWGNLIPATGTMEATLGFYNPLRYRGYVYDEETELYYLQTRYYNPEIGRFINADNNFSNINLFVYCSNNVVNTADSNGEHWYYLWIDDLFEAVDEMLASASNVVYGRMAYGMSFYDPKAARDLWNSRPFQETKPSPEMQLFVNTMYDYDYTADLSITVDLPLDNTYAKTGISKVLSPNKQIDATYAHVGVGTSTPPSPLPIAISYSVGIVRGVTDKTDYAGPFLDTGAALLYGFDSCCWPGGSSAFSISISTSYGAYSGFDYYWCID